MLTAALLLAAQAAVPPPPPPAPTDWPFSLVTGDDYPAAALRAGDEGKVRYRLEIGTNGRVSACAVTDSSGSAPLDQATCRIVTRRARFAPARDGDGNAVPDSREGEIVWRLPDRD
jgi:protein TonB